MARPLDEGPPGSTSGSFHPPLAEKQIGVLLPSPPRRDRRTPTVVIAHLAQTLPEAKTRRQECQRRIGFAIMILS